MKIIAFDLDDVLCTRDKKYESLGPKKYNYCKPNQKMIAVANQLYDEGNYIKIFTARGMSQFNGDLSKVHEHLYDLTVKHLSEWNVKYHELILGKIHYDLLIDDKAINSSLVISCNDVYRALHEESTEVTKE